MLTKTTNLARLKTQIVLYKHGVIQTETYDLQYDEKRKIYYLTSLNLQGKNLNLKLIALKKQERNFGKETYIGVYSIQEEKESEISILELKITQSLTEKPVLEELLLEKTYKI